MADKDMKNLMKFMRKGPWNKEEAEEDSFMDANFGGEQKKFNVRILNVLKATKILTFSRVLNSCLSIFLIGQFVVYTYQPEMFINPVWAWANTIIRLFLIIQEIIELLVATDLMDHIFSMAFFVELILTVPYFAIFIYLKQPPDLDRVFIFHITFTNLVAVFKLHIICELIENEVNKQLMGIFITVLSIVLIFSGLTMYIYKVSNTGTLNESIPNKAKLDSYGFYDYIYFVMTIVSTVGFENPFFENPVLRLFIVVVIIISIATIPAKSSDLVTILSNKSVYSRISYKRVDNTEFIVLCGSLGTSSVQNFLTEFFHSDHGKTSQRHCIVLNPSRPDNDMENLLREPKYEKKIFYIQGDPLDEIDLRRAQADKAKAVIIMCDKHSAKPDAEDSKTILIAIYIKKFLGTSSTTRLCFQLLRTDGKSHYSLPNKQDKNEQLICLEELKLSLFAKSCLCPGLIAIITNLINSAGDLESDSTTPKWLEEYWHGMGFEIYKTQLSKVFRHKTFAEAANIIYRKFNAILFGVEVENSKMSRICINPGLKVLSKEQNIGYIIAQDKEVADKIRDFDLQNRLQNMDDGKDNQKMVISAMSTMIKDNMDIDTKQMNASATADFNSNIQKNCVVSKTRIDIADVTKESMNGNILASKHIILAGLVSNLHHFVIPLRSKYLDKIPPIIILNEERPDHKTWSSISYFPEIYFVKGSALNEKDLYRVNIMKASRVVILSNRIELDSNDSSDKSNLKDKEDLLDAQTIFKYLNVTRIRRDIPIITELIHPSNISFLIHNITDYNLMKKNGYYHTEIYAMGETYISSVMDTLLAQAFYNSALIGVLDQVIVGNTTISVNEAEESSNLFPLRVPNTFVGKTFSELFHFLCERKHIIAVGLYRYDATGSGRKPYIVTNPPVDLILTKRDMVFVLAKSMIDYESNFT